MVRPTNIIYDIAFFVALLATAMALGGALAHVLELPNKIGLSADEYFVVQKVYYGWNRLAFLLLIEIISMIVVTIFARHTPLVFWPALFAIVFLVCAQAVFWVFTFPANVATENWTQIPQNWQVLRARWEYSHAAGAGFQLLAMASLILSVIRRSHM